MRTRLALLALAGLTFAANAQPAGSTPAAPAQPATSNADLPAAEAVIAKYIKALGGEEAIRRHTSRTDKGTVTMGGVSGDMVIQSAAPNRKVSVFTAAGVGTIREGFDGAKGWRLSPQGNAMLEGEALADRARTSDFYGPLNLLKDYTVRVIGQEPIDGRPAHRLGLIHKQTPGGPEQFMLFDAESGLLVKRIAERQSAAGPIVIETVISDYKEFDGVKVATKIAAGFMGQQQIMTIDSVEFDNVPDSAFDIPAELSGGGEK